MTASLPDLPRAALAAKEGYGWMHVLAFAYCVVIGLFSVGAWAAEDMLFRAAICGGAQVLSIILALLARRAFTGQMAIEGVVCVAFAFGFSTWAAAGLEHAWATNDLPVEQWQVWFLTGSEPAIFLLIEHIKEGRETLRAAHERDARETADELARIRAKEEASRQKPPAQPVNDRQMGEGATVTRLKLVERPADVDETPGADRQAGDASADQPVDELPALKPPPHDAETFTDPEAHARHLISVEGVRHRNELARRARGLSTYKAAQLLDELAPGWRGRKSAAA